MRNQPAATIVVKKAAFSTAVLSAALGSTGAAMNANVVSDQLISLGIVTSLDVVRSNDVAR